MVELPAWAQASIQDASKSIWKWDDTKEQETVVMELLDNGELIVSEKFGKEQVRFTVDIDGVTYDWYVGSKRLRTALAQAMVAYPDLPPDNRPEHIVVKVTKQGNGLDRSYGVKLMSISELGVIG